MFLDIVIVAHARAGKADELPAPPCRRFHRASDRRTFLDDVLAEEGKENGRFDLLQGLVLAGGRKGDESLLESLQAVAVNLGVAFLCLDTQIPAGASSNGGCA